MQQIVTSLLTAIETSTHPPHSKSIPPIGADPPSTTSTPQAQWAVASRHWRRHLSRVAPAPPDPLANPPYWLAPDTDPHCDPEPTALTDAGHAAAQTGESPEERVGTQGPPESNPWHSPTLCPLRLCSHVVGEAQFNQGLQDYGNKANLLSALSLELAGQLLRLCPPDCHAVIDFDRHGGRKHYAPLLWQHFAPAWLNVVSETPRESCYLWQDTHRTVHFRFSVDGERRFPVAVASLASKYTRELGMECFNACWQSQVPDLKPTAGYPQDAARWLSDLQSHVPHLRYPRESLWRNA
jgi:hypothetical protein